MREKSSQKKIHEHKHTVCNGIILFRINIGIRANERKALLGLCARAVCTVYRLFSTEFLFMVFGLR